MKDESKSRPARGLGRGLGALISETDTEAGVRPSPSASPPASPESGVFACPIGRIRLNPLQPRETFDRTALGELTQSIKDKGVLQPVLLRAKDDGYQLIAGERRYRASVEAGLTHIPAVVKDVSDRESLELALIENLQRVDLNPIEEAQGYQTLMDDFSLTQEDVAGRVGKDRTTVANMLRLLRLPIEIQQDLRSGALQVGHAKALLSLSSAEDMLRLRDRILQGRASVRQAERLARKKKPAAAEGDPNLKQLETDLRNHFGTKVRIEDRNQKGTVVIEYYSWNNLHNIVKKILA
ncbi:MAG: ParB/RepB/Spo0J family partition protein [Nitrospirae bacterium]|nr:ParB/RepB/Spo0J family partition protein [Nitrospirota bacterium]